MNYTLHSHQNNQSDHSAHCPSEFDTVFDEVTFLIMYTCIFFFTALSIFDLEAKGIIRINRPPTRSGEELSSTVDALSESKEYGSSLLFSGGTFPRTWEHHLLRIQIRV